MVFHWRKRADVAVLFLRECFFCCCCYNSCCYSCCFVYDVVYCRSCPYMTSRIFFIIFDPLPVVMLYCHHKILLTPLRWKWMQTSYYKEYYKNRDNSHSKSQLRMNFLFTISPIQHCPLDHGHDRGIEIQQLLQDHHHRQGGRRCQREKRKINFCFVLKNLI